MNLKKSQNQTQPQAQTTPHTHTPTHTTTPTPTLQPLLNINISLIIKRLQSELRSVSGFEVVLYIYIFILQRWLESKEGVGVVVLIYTRNG